MLTDKLDTTLILVVEDDDNHVSLIQRSFEATQDGYRLVITGTLRDACKVLEQNAPALVLADYILPDGDGSELVLLVKRACPVILMTSHGSEQVAVSTIKAGAHDYIVKSPDTFSTLPRIVKMALREWDLIQERRKIHEAVIRGKREWEQTFDAVHDLISIIDTNHNIIRANRAMADRCGLRPEDLPGRKCYEVMHGMTSMPASCPHFKMILEGNEHTEEVEEKRLAGIFEVTVSPLYDDTGGIAACVHVAHDITERKKAEEDRLALEQQLLQNQKLESLGVLAGGIAHDFNNILMIILGHCFLAQEDINSGLTNKPNIEKIEAAANRAADLCRQMLTYAGKSPLVQTQVNMWLLVDEIAKMLKSAIKKNVSFELDLRRDVPLITGDMAQIQQVVMNLIINAAEAIDGKNGTVRIELAKLDVSEGQTVRDFLGNSIPAGRYALLKVSDTGCGMDQETQRRIFEPFFTTKLTGRGLGLSAILGIIKSHNGSLQLSSIPGAGTTFKVYLPQKAKPDYAANIQTTETVSSAKGKGTILFVDDEDELRIIGTALLADMGFSAIMASNGREALEIYCERGSGIDLIFMDLIMPVMGGNETYLELRKIDPSVPIVICSGYDNNEITLAIGNDEHADFVQKPYRPEQMRYVLSKLLNSTGQHLM